MNTLSESQCIKLDQILQAFGNEEYLDSEKILEIEPVERKANGLVNILKDRGFVIRLADTEGQLLPLSLLIESSADLFLENGGFMAEFQRQKQREQNAGAPHINIHATGHGNMINTGNHNTIHATFNNAKGDLRGFQDELKRNLVSDEDVQEISDIVISEAPINNTFGSNTIAWIKKMLYKSVDGTWELGIATAGGILTEGIKKYYGM